MRERFGGGIRGQLWNSCFRRCESKQFILIMEGALTRLGHFWIHGDSFPAHVIWDKSETVKIRVKFPSALEVKEVFNVPPGGAITLPDGTAELAGFIMNGYVGLVLRSKRLEDTLVRERVTFEIE